MGKTKITKLPITYEQKQLNTYGNGYVPCQISDRWLQFSENIDELGFIGVDVMTKNKNDVEQKICQLYLDVNYIIRAINSATKD